MMKSGNLYHVRYDGQDYYVEAHCFPVAIGRWKNHVKKLWGREYDGTEEPESVALVHEGPVIRA